MESNDSSDTSDEDYVPNEFEVASEEEDSGEEEQFVYGEDDDQSTEVKEHSSHSKCSKQPIKPCKRNLVGRRRVNRDMLSIGDKNPGDGEMSNDNLIHPTNEIKEQEDTKKTDKLWESFMKDIGTSKTTPKPEPGMKKVATVDDCSSSTDDPSSASSSLTTKSNKITVVKEYDFAGETVVVTKELDVGSKEAQQAISSNTLKNISQPLTTASLSESTIITTAAAPILKRPSGGLNTLLGKLNKKPKLSTLEKSKLDWDGFKQKEGINDELKIHNRGKDGYLERVAFLERTDQRQFELERNLRLGSSQKQ